MELLSSDRLLKVIPEEVQTAQSLHASMDWFIKVIKSAYLKRDLKRYSDLKIAQAFEILIRIGFYIIIYMPFQNIHRGSTIYKNNIMKVQYVKSFPTFLFSTIA